MSYTEKSFMAKQYRLRAGNPMPIGNGEFVLHTFMAEEADVEIVACTDQLPSSTDFRGQGGNLMSASFSRLNVKSGSIFNGKKVYAPTYVDEDVLNG
jgi:hypothetical protein